jgi:hypothetical protein
VKASLRWLPRLGVGAGFILGWSGFEGVLHAERVRTLYANDQRVEPVYLSMGRSTVLRFDEKPKTVVIGNQNYFSVAYIGNDISIQPVGITTTNVFVYTESQTFSLILKVGPSTQYDDLVNVKWRPSYMSVGSSKKRGTPVVGEIPLADSLEIPSLIRVRFEEVLQTIAGVSVLKLSVENLSAEKLAASDIEIRVSENGAPVVSTAPMFREGNALAPKSQGDMRILFRPSSPEQLSFAVTCHGQTAKSTGPHPKKGHLRSKKQKG